MQSLTRYLHDFIRDVRLSEQEWKAAIEFLTACGHITDEHRQEFEMLSHVLGVSMQTIAVNNVFYAHATQATVFGPFFVDGSRTSRSAATSPAAPSASLVGWRARSQCLQFGPRGPDRSVGVRRERAL